MDMTTYAVLNKKIKEVESKGVSDERLNDAVNNSIKFNELNEQYEHIVTKVEGFEEVINRLPSKNIIEKTIENSILNLGTELYQKCTMEDLTKINLPTVTSFTEIHLFFSTSEALTLVLPSCKWQSQPSIEGNKVYEFIFTFTDRWLGGCIVYE